MDNELSVLISTQLEETNKKLDGLVSRFNKGSKYLSIFSMKASNISKSFNFQGITNGINNVLNGIKKISSVISESKDAINDYSETLNLFNLVMGEKLTDQANEFQRNMIKAFGNYTTEQLNMQARFQSMTESLGLEEDYAYIISENMTKLAYDLASLFNTSQQRASQALQSALVGQTRPIRSYGMDVTQNTMSTTLEALGITDRTVTQLSQVEKELLRYISLLRQSTLAQGDFANTIESPSNQLKVLNNQLKECRKWFGALFINTFAKALPYINAVTMVLKNLLQVFAYLLGYTGEDYNAKLGTNDYEDAEDSISAVGESADNSRKSVEKLKREILSFDQIHNINEDTGDSSSGDYDIGSGGIDQRLLDALEGYDNLMDKVKMKALEISNEYLKWLGFIYNDETGLWEVGTALDNIYLLGNKIGSSITTTLNSIKWEKIQENLNKLSSNIGIFLNGFTDGISGDAVGSTIAGAINSVTGFITTFISTYNWANLGILMADSINSAIEKTDWLKVGETLASKIKIAIDTMYGFIKTLDFGELGKALAEILIGAWKSINWDEVGSIILEGLKGIVDGFFNFNATLSESETVLGKIVPLIEGLALAIGGMKIATTLVTIASGFSKLGLAISSLFTGSVSLALKGTAFLPLANVLATIKASLVAVAGALGTTIAPILAVVGVVVALVGALIYAYNHSEAFRSKVNELGENVANIFKGIFEVISVTLQQIWEVIEPAWNLIKDTVIYVVQCMYENIVLRFSNILDIINGVVETIGFLIDGDFDKAFDRMVQIVSDLVDNWIRYFNNLGNDFLKWIKNSVLNFENFKSKLREKIDAIISFIAELPSKFGYWFGQAVGTAIRKLAEIDWKQKGKELVDKIITGLGDFLVNLGKWASDFISGLWKKLTNVKTDGMSWKDIGKKVLDGIINGMFPLANTFKDWSKGFIKGLKDALDIHSPSKLTIPIGTFTFLGIKEGMEKEIPSIQNTALKLVDTLQTTFDKGMYDLSLESAMMPTLTQDITDVKSYKSNIDIDYNSLEKASYNGFSRAIKQYGLVNINVKQDKSSIVETAIDGINNITKKTGESPIDIW